MIIALPHMGNFEQAGAWVIARGAGKFTTVQERLRPESVYESFVRFRQGLGFEVLPLTGGGSPFGTLAQRLRAGGLVCLVSDRDLKESGVEVEMFGEKARIAAAAALAVHTGAALMPTATWFDGDDWGARIYDEIPVPETGTRAEKVAAMSQQLARVFSEAIAEHPQDWHMLQRVFTADLDPARLARARVPEPTERAMKIGITCPYSWDVPGGVQQHIRDLAEALIDEGHEVSVISPADDDTPLPRYVVRAGRAVPVPYNGSVARLSFGFLSVSRVRRWIREGGFDVLHVHEPEIPSLSLLACWVATGPIVATVHTAIPRSRILLVTYPVVRTGMEKINGRIAVSEAARTTLVEHIGGDAVVIPNGVATRRYRKADPLPGWPGPGGAIGFLGRLDEPRKGLSVLLKAFEILGPARPGLRLLIAGPAADAEEVLHRVPAGLRDRVVLLGQVSEEDKVRVLHSVDVFCSPNTGGESFGIVTAEAMAAGVPIVASDIDAFQPGAARRRGGGAVRHRGRRRPGPGGRPAARRRLPPGRAFRRGAGRGGRLRLVGRRPRRVQRLRDRRPRPHPGRRHRVRRRIPPGRLAMITDIVIVVALALFTGVYVSWRAGRIDRLHARVEMARTALDVTLLRRSSVALELATSGLLDPATSLLLAAAVHGTSRRRPPA